MYGATGEKFVLEVGSNLNGVGAIVEAEDDEAILDALDKLLPRCGDFEEEAGCRRPKTFIAKMSQIKMGANAKIDAISDYVSSKLLRYRWHKKKLDQTKLSRFEDRLLSHYHLVCAVRPSGMATADESVNRGKKTFADCMSYAEGQEVPGFIVDERVARGEYHRLANNEGKEEIGWHPGWKEQTQ